MLGTWPIDIAITEMTKLLRPLKIKLDAGVSNTLAIMMGIVKIKRLRPADISTRLSLPIKTAVVRVKKTVAATFPDQYLLEIDDDHSNYKNSTSKENLPNTSNIPILFSSHTYDNKNKGDS